MPESAENQVVNTVPKSIQIAEGGIENARQFRRLMATIASDVLTRRITPAMANSVTNAGGKMLKAAEMEVKYGTVGNDNRRHLPLADGDDSASTGAAQ